MAISKEKYNFLLYILLMILVFLLIQIFVYHQGIITKQHAELIDTDTYMRLVRAEQLAETGDWYDSVIHRSNFPVGDDSHWTRPLDVILLAGAYILTPFQGFHNALLTWGIILSPVLGIFCLLALFWATRTVIKMNAGRLLLLLFITQLISLQVFRFGRPDHHSLLTLFFILILGCLFRMVEQPDNNKYALLIGFIAALSLWVSVETIFAIVMVFAALGILWLIRGEAYARQLLLFSLSIFFFTTVFLFFERPLSSIFIAEYDKISIVYIFVLAIAVSAIYFLTLIKDSSLFMKLVKFTLILIMSGSAIWLVFPAFFRGPMAGINKAIVPIWLSKVEEVQPLWSYGSINATIVIGSMLLFLLYLTYMLIKEGFASHFTLLIPIITGFVIFMPLGIYQIRMDNYLLIITVILLSVCLDDIMTRISNSKLAAFYKPMLRAVIIFLFILGLPCIGLTAPSDNNSANNTIKPDLKALSCFLNDYKAREPQVKTILTCLNFGPELLYRTEFNIISSPYHRNDQGILYNYQVMAADSLEQAQVMLRERSVDFIILSPESNEKKFYKTTPDHSTFYEHLVSGEVPSFLEKVKLDQEISQTFIIYRVNTNK